MQALHAANGRPSQTMALANLLAVADLTPLAMPCMIPRMSAFVHLQESGGHPPSRRFGGLQALQESFLSCGVAGKAGNTTRNGDLGEVSPPQTPPPRMSCHSEELGRERMTKDERRD